MLWFFNPIMEEIALATYKCMTAIDGFPTSNSMDFGRAPVIEIANSIRDIPSVIAIKLFAALAICLVTCPASAHAVYEAGGAEAFLRRIYVPYVAGDHTVDPTGKLAPMIFDQRLTALIRKDEVHPLGEIGALDQDPICDCQDFNHIKLISVKFLRWNPTKATADVRFINLNTVSVLRYTLTKSKRGWRVTDIATQDMPSLVAFLQEGTRRQ